MQITLTLFDEKHEVTRQRSLQSAAYKNNHAQTLRAAIALLIALLYRDGRGVYIQVDFVLPERGGRYYFWRRANRFDLERTRTTRKDAVELMLLAFYRQARHAVKALAWGWDRPEYKQAYDSYMRQLWEFRHNSFSFGPFAPDPYERLLAEAHLDNAIHTLRTEFGREDIPYSVPWTSLGYSSPRDE